MEVKNQLKLVPQLLLTPQLKLLLKVLPMNTLELQEYLLEEVNNNPFLEVEFKDLPIELLRKQTKSRDEVHLNEEVINEEVDWDFGYVKYHFGEEEPEEEVNLLERTVKAEESLADYLLWQLNLKDVSELDKRIAQYIIGNLDDRGYLRVSPEDISKDTGLPLERIEKVRMIIKFLDPVGVASLNLKECLLAQLESLGFKEDSLPYRIVKEYLEEIPKGIEVLSQLLKSSPEEVEEALSVIKGLEPYPARNFRSVNHLSVVPDLRFYEEDGEWKVEVLKQSQFEVKLNNYYTQLLKRNLKGLPKQTQEYLREKMRMAETLLKALDYRYTTLYRIGKAILDHQKEFFEKGPKYLKPLTLKMLAEETNLHESTVSRVVSQKYADTPLGILPLKYFLSWGFVKSSGEGVSSKAIMNYLKELIEKEDKSKPLSDAELAKELQKRLGVKIARRTVTKYREMLNIPSIRERKKK
jgi:RNA polymerase sigma-54 factor